MFMVGVIIVILTIIYMCCADKIHKRRGSPDDTAKLPPDNSGSGDNAH